MIGFLFGLVVGAVAGILIMSLLIIGREEGGR